MLEHLLSMYPDEDKKYIVKILDVLSDYSFKLGYEKAYSDMKEAEAEMESTIL